MASAPIHKKVCMLQNLFSYCVLLQGSRPGRVCLVPGRAGPPHGERHELRWTPRLRRRHRRQGRGRRRQRQGERGGGTFAKAELCAVVGPAASSTSVSLTCGRPLEGRLVGVRLWRKAWKKSCRLRRPCRGEDLVVWYSKEKNIFISMQ